MTSRTPHLDALRDAVRAEGGTWTPRRARDVFANTDWVPTTGRTRRMLDSLVAEGTLTALPDRGYELAAPVGPLQLLDTLVRDAMTLARSGGADTADLQAQARRVLAMYNALCDTLPGLTDDERAQVRQQVERLALEWDAG